VLKKRRQHPDNVLFIDASQGFEKVKTQNVLRPEDIDRILATYQARENVEKYSHVATRAEIAENDYNLNIPRYVDTFEAEKSVDLKAVATRLRSLETEMAATDTVIAGFCEELGIEMPF
jgi:type I restriction enzyme M protein